MENTGAKEEVKQEGENKEAVAAPTKTYTQEELDAILNERELQNKEREEARVKGLSKVITKKDDEIKSLKETSPGDYTLQTLQKMASIIENSLATGEYNEETARKAKGELKSLNAQITLNRAKSQQTKIDTVRNNLHNKIKEAGEDVNSPKFRAVRAYFKQGLFEEASDEIDEILSKKETKVEKEEPKKSDKELRDEIRAEVMKEFNLTKQESTKPSAAVSSFAKIEKDYAEGKIKWADYNKARKEQGI